jgi:hypothetical protein
MFTTLHKDDSEYGSTAPFSMPSYKSVMQQFSQVKFTEPKQRKSVLFKMLAAQFLDVVLENVFDLIVSVQSTNTYESNKGPVAFL